MRFAYADPPYLGCGKKHYPEHPDSAEWDNLLAHNELTARLVEEYPDGWALSCNLPSLHRILNLHALRCVEERLRLGAWVKPFASFKPGVNPAYAWEPVIFYGGRKRGRELPTMRDWVSANITLKKGTHGAKPPQFYEWILDWLNVWPEDTLDDLFPGTGSLAVVRAAREAK